MLRHYELMREIIKGKGNKEGKEFRCWICLDKQEFVVVKNEVEDMFN